MASEAEWQYDYSFRFAVEAAGGTTLLRFSGALDAVTAKHLQRRGPIPRPPIDAMVLDLTELDYIDVGGVREIRRIEALAGSAEIRGPSDEIQDLLDLIPGNALRAR